MRLPGVLIVSLAFGSGCAVLHRSAIGENVPNGTDSVPVEVGINELGLDREDIADTSAAIARSGGSSTMDGLADMIELVTWATSQSPRTGEPTMTDTWADETLELLKKHCPSGRISGIQTLRESAKYPYVSGEIVRVRANCYRGG